MNYRQLGNVLMATLVLATLAAPAARADSGPWIRWKQGYRQPVQRQYHGDNGAGPAIAGFIGGLVLGSQLHSHAVVACPPPRRVVYAPPPCEYEYYDPYCDETFSSLDECYDHIQYEDYPMVVQQIDIRTGDCVDNYEWSGGRWNSRGRGFDYRGAYDNRNYRGGRYGQGSGYNRGGYDNRGYNNGGNGDRRYRNYGNGNGWNRNGRGNGRGNDNGRWNDHGGRGRNGRGHGIYGRDQGGRGENDQGD